MTGLARSLGFMSHSFEMGQGSDMIRLAALDIGVTIVPASAVTEDGSVLEVGEECRAIRLADKSAVFPVSVFYDPPHPSPAASAFLETLEHHQPDTI